MAHGLRNVPVPVLCADVPVAGKHPDQAAHRRGGLHYHRHVSSWRPQLFHGAPHTRSNSSRAYSFRKSRRTTRLT
eukprot:7387163-Prymnesium_polylepis.1